VRDGRLSERTLSGPDTGSGPPEADNPGLAHPAAAGTEPVESVPAGAVGDRDAEQVAAAEPQPGASEVGAREQRLVAQIKQLSADFENFRRRSKAELADARARGRDHFLGELVPVLVDLASACRQGPEETSVPGVLEGLRLLEEKLYGTISALGYQRVPTVGHAMDPTRHDALMAVQSDDAPPRTVVQEFAPGFERDGRVVVAAKVAVAKA